MSTIDFKNQLVLDFAAGSLGLSKSIFASTYLYLNSKASKLHNSFENYLGDNLLDNEDIPLSKLKYTDCISKKPVLKDEIKNDLNPISKILGPLENLEWKKIYKGFNEFKPKIPDNEELTLIKMDPGSSIPLHSHGGKEYILVLKGSFQDEFGIYNKGDIQINDQKIKHTPIASKDEGCICLTITEKDVIFFGRFGSFLNLFSFIKSFFK